MAGKLNLSKLSYWSNPNMKSIFRWTELTRKIELWAEIHELNEQGEYMPVEVSGKNEVLTGGVFQLRQVIL